MKRVDFYDALREMREQIVKAMQERGITEMAMCLPPEEWAKETGNEYEPDETGYDEDYDTYVSDESPYVIFFDKYNNGCDERVDNVRLKINGLGVAVLEFDCVEDESGQRSTFSEDYLVSLTLFNVYDRMYDLLEIGDDSREIVVAFGETATDAYDEGFKQMKRAIKNGDGQLLRRKFGSQGEVNAYLQGLEDQVGWESSVQLSAADCERHAKEINELIR